VTFLTPIFVERGWSSPLEGTLQLRTSLSNWAHSTVFVIKLLDQK